MFKHSLINGQSAAEPLNTIVHEEGSETIPKGSRISNYLFEKPDIAIFDFCNFKFHNFYNLSAIYCIYIGKKDMGYIGSSVNLGKRIYEHKRRLCNNTHYNILLQKSFNKYTISKFKIIILETCNASELEIKEKYWIDYFDTINNGFNVTNDTSRNFYNQQLIDNNFKRFAKPVLMFEKNGNFVRRFSCVKHAAEYIKDQSTNISSCCKLKLHTVKGYIFRYEDGFEELITREKLIGTQNLKLLEKCRIATSKPVICNGIKYPSVSETERILNIPRNSLGYAMKVKKLYKNKYFCEYCNEDIVRTSEKFED